MDGGRAALGNIRSARPSSSAERRDRVACSLRAREISIRQLRNEAVRVDPWSRELDRATRSLATISHGNYETRVRRCTDTPARVCVRRARLAVQALLDRTVLEANNSEKWRSAT
jgi:hypothetical protein